MKTPDITPAQVLAVVTFFIGQLVAYGAIDGTVQQSALSAAATVIPAVFALADAMIRGKRNDRLAAEAHADAVVAINSP